MNILNWLRKSLGVNRNVLALALARMADGIGNSILFVIIPLYVAKLPHKVVHFPEPLMVGVLLSAYGLANAALQPFTAKLSDRLGRYKLIIQFGLGCIGLATLAFIFAGRYLDLLGLRIAQGFGLAMEIPPTMALMAIVSRRQTRGGAMGFYTTLRMLGLTLGPLLGGFLHDRSGFNAAFCAAAAILFLAIVVVQFGVEEVPGRVRTHAVSTPPSINQSLLSPGILSAALATFLMASAFTLVTTLEKQFNQRLDIGAFSFSIAFSSLMVGRLLFQVPCGRISDYIGRKPFVLGGLLLLAIITGFLGEVNSLLEFTLLRFIQGIAAAAIVAPALAFAGDIAHSNSQGRQGQQMSIVTMGFGLGIAFGPLLAGVLSIFSFELPFLVDGVFCFIGAVMVYLFMPETVGEKEE